MTRIRVYPYKQGSKSAKALARGLGGKVLRRENSKYNQRLGDLIVNWGSSSCPYTDALNSSGVAGVANKLTFFTNMQEACSEYLPPFWTTRDGVLGHPSDVFSNGGLVVCRTDLVGHSGSGVVIASRPEELVEASLYTLYIKKKDEYRVHVGKDGAFSVQRKARRLSVPADEVDWQVRSYKNGFVYSRENVSAPLCVLQAAEKVFNNTSLDFGAVDVIYNEHQDRAYVLEVNTAPGLEGQTVLDYVGYFQSLWNRA